MQSQAEQLVARVAETFSTGNEVSEDQISEALVSEGFPLDLTERAIAFVPIAFGRQYLGASSVRYQDRYTIRDIDSGRSFRGLLSEDSVFRLAWKLARQWHAARDRSEFVRVANHSVELAVILKLTREGSSLSNLALTELTFLRIPLPE